MRGAGSGRARREQPDLLASNGKKVLGIECKYSGNNYKSISKEEVNALIKFCREFGCTPVLAYRFPRMEWKFKIITEFVGDNVNVKSTDEFLSINSII